MFGSPEVVRGTARIFNGYLIEAFNQGDRVEGVGNIMRALPETSDGICKSLCMNWIAHHANDVPTSFAEAAKAMVSGANLRSGGNYSGVAMALNQLAYGRALDKARTWAEATRIKDAFTDEFLRKRGILRQMKISNPARNLVNPGLKPGRNNRAVDTAFAWRLAKAIVGKHSAGYWSYKLISLHGPAGGHALAAFVGADAMFFDPNYGIFYFEKAADFEKWFGAPGGFYWESGYVKELGNDYVIKSYAKGI